VFAPFNNAELYSAHLHNGMNAMENTGIFHLAYLRDIRPATPDKNLIPATMSVFAAFNNTRIQ
jgi:hypothetical protein